MTDLGALTHEERQRVLSQLPPDQRKAAEAQLRSYDELPPQQRERVARQYEAFRNLPPAKQNQIRQSYGFFQRSLPERQTAMRNELHSLSALPPNEQARQLESHEVKAQFSSDERKAMRGLLDAPDRD